MESLKFKSSHGPPLILSLLNIVDTVAVISNSCYGDIVSLGYSMWQYINFWYNQPV